MSAHKKPRSYKTQILVIAGLLILIIGVFQGYKSLQPEPVHAPIESPSPKPEINGIYKGNLPCADCSGITETLILAKDGSYILEDLYKGKSTKPFQIAGKWEIINSDILKLTPSDNSEENYFQLTDKGGLQMLNNEMQKIDSPFNQILNKEN